MFWSLLKISLIIPFLVNIALGIYVLRKDPKNKVNLWFSIFAFSVALWVFSNLLFYSFFGTFFTAKLMYATAPIPISTAIIWILYLTKKRVTNFKKILIFIPGIFFLVLSLIDKLILAEIDSRSWIIPREAKMGILFLAFVLYAILYILIALSFVALEYKKSKGLRKVQLRYILIGFLAMGLIPIFTSLLLPLFSYSDLAFLDAHSSFIWIGACAYAIGRYRFMDIRVAIRKGVTYTIMLGFVLLIPLFAVLLLGSTLEKFLGLNFVLVSAILALLIAFFFHPLKRLIEKGINHFFFPSHYILKEKVEEFDQLIDADFNIESLLKKISQELINTLKVEDIHFLLEDKRTGEFKSEFYTGPKEIILPRKDPLISYFKEYNETLVYEELSVRMSEAVALKDLEELKEVKQRLRELKIAMAVPIRPGSDLIAILLFSEKLSREAFTEEDVQLARAVTRRAESILCQAIFYRDTVHRLQREYDIKAPFQSRKLG